MHGDRLAALLNRITFDHRGVHLSWSGPGTDAECFTPRVRLTAPDVHDTNGTPIALRWFEYWADDQLIAACAHGASDDEILALAVAQAHYALATLLVHEVGEWFTYRGRQVYPPHRPDPYVPQDEDGGPDGNGAIVLWLTYPHPAGPAPGPAPGAPLPAAARISAGSASHLAPLPAAVPGPVAAHRVDPADIGTLPGQLLILDSHQITVTPPHALTATRGTWSPVPDQHDALAQALRDIHRVMVMSELAVLATCLHLNGAPVLALAPGPSWTGAPWHAHLTDDG
ncbi:hypothetical protein ACH4U6_36415 [Streptomyces netropsis]|uniref:hypothetical protein n=1 Tax=Streptomyces netropsis TaxID=55404 RepID=UPI0037A88BD1